MLAVQEVLRHRSDWCRKRVGHNNSRKRTATDLGDRNNENRSTNENPCVPCEAGDSSAKKLKACVDSGASGSAVKNSKGFNIDFSASCSSVKKLNECSIDYSALESESEDGSLRAHI